MPRFPQILLASALVGALVPVLCAQTSSKGADATSQDARRKGSFVTIHNVAVKHGADGSAIEITSSVAVIPSITVLDGPPRLIIDLLGAIDAAAKQVNGAGGEISDVRITQYDESPPLTRITVDLKEPRTYVWEVVENRVLVHLKPLKDSPSRNPVQAARPLPVIPAPVTTVRANPAAANVPPRATPATVVINRTPITPNSRPFNPPQPNGSNVAQPNVAMASQPVGNVPMANRPVPNQPMQPMANQPLGNQPPIASQGVAPAGAPAGTRGTVLLAGKSMVGDSAVTAGVETAILNLARGGQISVCPGTTASVTSSKTGRDVMLGMSTGSLEVHYRLGASQDSILTPDFRILLQGPGEFHYAFSADARGNTCVRTLQGNSAGALIYELMGDGVYRVKPSEQVVFHGGQLAKPGSDVPIDCGCPSTHVPVLRVEGPTTAPPVMAASAPAPKKDAPIVTEQATAAPMPMPDTAPPVRQERKVPVQAGMPASSPEAPIQTSQVQIQVDAPLVYRAKDPGASGGGRSRDTSSAEDADEAHPPNEAAAGAQTPAAPTDKVPPKPKKGFFGRVKHFIANVFG